MKVGSVYVAISPNMAFTENLVTFTMSDGTTRLSFGSDGLALSRQVTANSGFFFQLASDDATSVTSCLGSNVAYKTGTCGESDRFYFDLGVY